MRLYLIHAALSPMRSHFHFMANPIPIADAATYLIHILPADAVFSHQLPLTVPPADAAYPFIHRSIADAVSLRRCGILTLLLCKQHHPPMRLDANDCILHPPMRYTHIKGRLDSSNRRCGLPSHTLVYRRCGFTLISFLFSLSFSCSLQPPMRYLYTPSPMRSDHFTHLYFMLLCTPCADAVTPPHSYANDITRRCGLVSF